MILVTGATGHLGKLTIDFLLTKLPPSSIAALVRSKTKSANLEALGVELRIADYFDYDAMVLSLTGIDTLVLISSGSLENRVKQHTNAINAARECGVSHIVYTSMVGASQTMKFVTGSDHFHTEFILKETGIPYTILRNGFYTEALAEQLIPALNIGQWHYPGDGASLNSVARTDLAEVLAQVSQNPPAYQNQTYTLTGSRAYSFSEIASIVNGITGRPFVYIPIPLDAYASALQNAGVPESFIAIIVSVAEAQQAGQMSEVDTSLATLLNREPENLQTTLQRLLNERIVD